MKFWSKVFMVASIAGLTANLSYAQPAELVAPSKQQTQQQAQLQLQQLIAKLADFKAQFSQQVFDQQKQLVQQTQGELAIAKPNQLYWHVKQPEETFIIAQGEILWLYDPFVEQATKYQQAQVIANTPLLLLTDQDPAIWQQYRVQQLSPQQYQVQALATNSQVSAIKFTFSGDFTQLTQIILTEASGQQSEITLTEQQALTDANLFNFTPPQGVTIDDQSQS